MTLKDLADYLKMSDCRPAAATSLSSPSRPAGSKQESWQDKVTSASLYLRHLPGIFAAGSLTAGTTYGVEA